MLHDQEGMDGDDAARAKQMTEDDKKSRRCMVMSPLLIYARAVTIEICDQIIIADAS